MPMMAAVTLIDGVWWGFDRGAGLAALALLTLTTLLVTATGWRLDGSRVAAVQRTLALLAVAFAAVHAIGAVADRLVDIRPIDALVPFGSAFDPFWTGLGALSADLVLAIGITIALRRRLGAGAWRVVRWLAYPCWAIAVLHAVGMGAGLGGSWGLAVASASAGLMAAALAWRSAATGAVEEPPRPVPVLTPEPARPEPEPEPAPRHVVPAPLWSSGEPPDAR
jgi:sulfoxide reductase heme-binding subunit YedZ